MSQNIVQPYRFAGDFIPTNISSCVGWWDISDIDTITKDGSNLVSQVDDKSGNSYNLIQNTGANQPTWLSADQNGLDTLSFFYTGSGASYSMQIASATIATQPLTMVIAYLSGDGATSGQCNLYGAGGTRCDYYDFSGAESDRHRIYAGAQLKYNEDIGHQWNQLTNLYNGVNSFMRLNGVEKTSGNSGSASQADLAIGSDNDGNQSMKIGEIICYDKELSASETTQVEDYLKDKWDTA